MKSSHCGPVKSRVAHDLLHRDIVSLRRVRSHGVPTDPASCSAPAMEMPNSPRPAQDIYLMPRSAHVAVLTLVLVASGVAGCSQGDHPPLGHVTGRVTIGGEPLSGAAIMFLPDNGRPAVGTTDKEGNYELMYLDGVKGCKVGPATIGFAVPTGGATSHAIPAKYMNKSDLKRDVKDGNQKFDFDLERDGKPVKAAAPRGPILD